MKLWQVRHVTASKPFFFVEVTSDSIESRILERANAKLKLETLTIQKGNFVSADSKSSITSLYDLQELLRNEDLSKVGTMEDDESNLFDNWVESVK